MDFTVDVKCKEPIRDQMNIEWIKQRVYDISMNIMFGTADAVVERVLLFRWYWFFTGA
jgi:hypothetical protein